MPQAPTRITNRTFHLGGESWRIAKVRKRLFFWMGAMLLLAIVSLWLLKQRSTELVHAIVLNAVVQKAPDDYPVSRIQKAFSQRLESAIRTNRGTEYLAELKVLSHRIEKRQFLSTEEVDEILEEISSP